MQKNLRSIFTTSSSILGMSLLLASCGSDNETSPITQQTIPQLSPAVGTSIKGSCDDLKSFSFEHTTITTVWQTNL